MSRLPIALLLVAATSLAAVAWVTMPHAIVAAGLLAAQEDPVALADREVARRLDSTVAAREIEAALAANDADLAQSFVDLASEYRVSLDPALVSRVETAVTAAHSATRTAEDFAKGLVTGEPGNLAGLAGTAAGDLFVFGDVRDLIREGTRLATGEDADHLVIGLAGVGLAVTAGTYVSLGSAAPMRVGLTVAKAARRTSRLGADMTAWITRSLRLKKTDGVRDLVRTVGRVQGKAGTQAAFDSLKIARGPRDMARIAKLAEKNGSKTRAILKLLGRGAIVLMAGSLQLFSWILWAALALLGFASSAKSAVERYTLRRLRRRKETRRIADLALQQGARA